MIDLNRKISDVSLQVENIKIDINKQQTNTTDFVTLSMLMSKHNCEFPLKTDQDFMTFDEKLQSDALFKTDFVSICSIFCQ